MSFSRSKIRLILIIVFMLTLSRPLNATEFHLSIDTIRSFLFTFVEMSINNFADASDSSLTNGKTVGSFSFLLSYDTSCLQFVEARKGGMLVEQGWQSFSYQSQINGTQGLIRITAVADTGLNDSTSPLPRVNQGEWVVLKFRTTNDRSLTGQCCPVSWYWVDCQNNLLSDSTGNNFWVVDTLYNSVGSPVDLRTAFPTDVSQCDTTLGNASKRFAVFADGYICVFGCDCIDDRGDLNLNGLAYEIADYFLYRNYFLYGDSVFSKDPARHQGQIAASEINGDSLALQVSDLVYLLRIIMGDTNPLPMAINSPSGDSAEFQIIRAIDHLTVWSNSPRTIRGVFLRLGFSGTMGPPVQLASTQNLESGYTVSSNMLRLLLSPPLISPLDTSNIPARNWPILSLPFVGDLQEVEIQASTYEGQELATTSSLIQARGDLNGDRAFTPTDVVTELKCAFLSDNCFLELADLNCDSNLSSADVLEILNLVFLGIPLSCN